MKAPTDLICRGFFCGGAFLRPGLIPPASPSPAGMDSEKGSLKPGRQSQCSDLAQVVEGGFAEAARQLYPRELVLELDLQIAVQGAGDFERGTALGLVVVEH